jgi:hypothetical protein
VIQPHLPVRLPCSCHSPCRHGARTVSSSCSDATLAFCPRASHPGARRAVSEGSTRQMRDLKCDFPADCPHRMHFHSQIGSSTGYTGVPSNKPSFSLAVTGEGRNSITTSPQSRIPPSTAPSQRVGPPASGVTHFRGVTGGDCDALEPSSRSHRTSTSRASGEPSVDPTPVSAFTGQPGRLLRLS